MEILENQSPVLVKLNQIWPGYKTRTRPLVAVCISLPSPCSESEIMFIHFQRSGEVTEI